MENATKALLIAAAILIAILIISLGIVVFNVAAETVQGVNMSDQEMELLENILTIKYMKKYSWKNVRGGFFSECDSSSIRKKLIKHSKDLPKEIIDSI